VPRLRIDDLPVAENLTPEQEELIQGAGLNSFRPSFEMLEAREMPALLAPGIDLTGNLLTIKGSDYQAYQYSATVRMNDAGQLQVTRGGSGTPVTLNRAEVTRIVYEGGAATEKFTNNTAIPSTFVNQGQGDKHVRFNLTSTPLTNDSANLDAKAMDKGQPIGDPIGKNIRPTLTWEAAPTNAKSFAVIMKDLDSPGGEYGHWVVFDIPANARELKSVGDLPGGTQEGLNDSGSAGYYGPNPRLGPTTHTYEITLYALKTDKLQLPEGVTQPTQDELVTAMRGQIIDQISVQRTYTLPFQQLTGLQLQDRIG
jgi:Raf kinase inhibitor-like YbhB/YbcL family protein